MAELNYKDLSIHQRINLKGLIGAWTDIAVERFQKEIQTKVYGARRSSRKRKLRQSGSLKQRWWSQTSVADAGNRVRLEFLQYGRFVDMGVGKGVDIHQARYARVRRNGEKQTRRPKKWYSRRKGFETHRLRELLTRYHVNLPIDLIENALTGDLTLTV